MTPPTGWTSDEEQDLLESWFARTALPRTPTHIGLFTTLPTADAGTGGVEATGGSYARVALAANGTNWGSSSAGGVGSPATIQNLVAVLFPTATVAWGTIVGWGYWTASTSGTLLYFGPLSSNVEVAINDAPDFQPGALIAKLGDPTDTY
jgi:hypothetical protein